MIPSSRPAGEFAAASYASHMLQQAAAHPAFCWSVAAGWRLRRPTIYGKTKISASGLVSSQQWLADCGHAVNHCHKRFSARNAQVSWPEGINPVDEMEMPKLWMTREERERAVIWMDGRVNLLRMVSARRAFPFDCFTIRPLPPSSHPVLAGA